MHLRGADGSTPARGTVGRLVGPVLMAAMGASLFVIVHPAVPDLQAAEARAAAAAHGVGVGYWLSWFGGSAPGDYSLLAPLLSALVGTALAGALAVGVIACVAPPLLAGSRRERSGAYLIVGLALCNLWSGRVPFGLGVAVALGGLLALRRNHPFLGGALNIVAAACSPLASAFVLLGLVGPAVTGVVRRRDAVAFAGLSLFGLAVPAVAFGQPGRMPFPPSTFVFTLLILVACVALWRSAPPHVRLSLGVAMLATLTFYVVPTGVGANVQRFACLVVPVVVWTCAQARVLLTGLAIIPAIVYTGATTVTDVVAAQSASAHSAYYGPLRDELSTWTDLKNHRVEVIDTPTHRGARELASSTYLARGWEVQSDTADNPVFYQHSLTSASYEKWLRQLAVAAVAVPSNPDSAYESEATLVLRGVPYLREVWHNKDWRLYAVDDPTPIVDKPARVVTETPDSLVIDVSEPATVVFRIRPSRYVRLTKLGANSHAACLQWVSPTAAHAVVTVPGQYRLDSDLTIAALLKQGCRPGATR